MISRIAVFCPNWVGDAVMATPTLRALRRRYPHAHIVGFMNPTIADVLRGSPSLDDVWLYQRRGGDRRLHAAALLRRMRAVPFDLSVHLTNDFASAAVSRLAGTRVRAGYARNARGWLLTDALTPLKRGRAFAPVPALDYYLEIAYALGCPRESPRMDVVVGADDERAAGNAWTAMDLKRNERAVLLNSSGAYGAAKLWPDEHFADLAARVARELGLPVVVLCGPAEEVRAKRIASLAAHPRVQSLSGSPLSIGLTKACIARGHCLVTTDSGPRHFGAALDIPVIALFGPTRVEWSDTRYAAETKLQIPVDCGPCGQRNCPVGHHRCMRDLSVDKVFAAVSRALASAVPA